MNEGRLPKPKPPTAAALRLLALYDGAEGGSRDAQAILQFELPRALPSDLAAYYEGVRLRREAEPVALWPDGYEDDEVLAIGRDEA